jgi:hypothetical protein
MRRVILMLIATGAVCAQTPVFEVAIVMRMM